jgi:DMSO/TMAO reductase YedYZ molybdopterin-dependent catalytic subunit
MQGLMQGAMTRQPRGSARQGARSVLAVLGAVGALLALTAQSPPPAVGAAGAARPLLQLVPLNGQPIGIGPADLEKLPRRNMQVAYPSGPEHQASPTEVSGVPLRALLDRMGVPSGHELRGDALQLYVVAEGADGYRAVLAVAEIDPSITEQTVLVADRRGGRLLNDQEGPLRLIVPADRRPARWVRQLVRISVRHAS